MNIFGEENVEFSGGIHTAPDKVFSIRVSNSPLVKIHKTLLHVGSTSFKKGS